MNHPENYNILSKWKALLDTYNTKPGREKALIVTSSDDDWNTAFRYLNAGVTTVRVTPLSENGSSLAERIENKLKNFNFKGMGWMVR